MDALIKYPTIYQRASPPPPITPPHKELSCPKWPDQHPESVTTTSSQQSTGFAKGEKEPHVEEVVGPRNMNTVVHAGLDPICAQTGGRIHSGVSESLLVWNYRIYSLKRSLGDANLLGWLSKAWEMKACTK